MLNDNQMLVPWLTQPDPAIRKRVTKLDLSRRMAHQNFVLSRLWAPLLRIYVVIGERTFIERHINAPRLAGLEIDPGETFQLLFGSWRRRFLAVHINLRHFSAGAFSRVLPVKRDLVARAGPSGVSHPPDRPVPVSELFIIHPLPK